jgi:hypothetical protein
MPNLGAMFCQISSVTKGIERVERAQQRFQHVQQGVPG